jgi:hypothetical protein
MRRCMNSEGGNHGSHRGLTTHSTPPKTDAATSQCERASPTKERGGGSREVRRAEGFDEAQ